MAETITTAGLADAQPQPQPLPLNAAVDDSPPGMPLVKRISYAVSAAAIAIVIAGFWNFRLVDGFGRDVIAGGTLGDPGQLADTFAVNGPGFGMLFAAVAGLAATFTACNCVVFAMLPGLAAAGQVAGRRQALSALGVFTLGVSAVCAAYGIFIGLLGADGVAAMNSGPVRIAQAQAVFTLLGIVMLLWGAFDLGFLGPLQRRLTPVTRAFLAQTTTRAALLGLLVGAFAVGRPFPVMRDFLTYAAAAESPLYGAAVMAIQGLGQIAVMVALFLALVLFFGNALQRWAARAPQQPALVGALAMIAGGAFFVFYWGLAFSFDIGRWGFKLGWY